MNLLWNLVVVLQILAALVMIGLVLVQHGKGADMGASFGSGASGSLFGATGSANFMSRSTAVCAAIFFACTLGLAYSSNDRGRPSDGASVLDRPAAAAPASAPLGGSALVPSTAAPGRSSTVSGAATSVIGSVPVPAAAPSPSTKASGAAAVPSR